MHLLPEEIIKLLLAALVGGIIGAEREVRSKAAGFRTIILICVGSALFTIISVHLAGNGDPARVAANIVTGIGFLGAGVIFSEKGSIRGLTTASTIWLSAALGMGLGAGYYLLSFFVTAMVVIVLWIFTGVERLIDKLIESKTYTIGFTHNNETMAHFTELFARFRLKARLRGIQRNGETVRVTWDVSGGKKAHAALAKQLFIESKATEFDF